MEHKKHPSCACCSNYFDFDLPEELLEELLRHNVVIFAGSGISTESKLVLPQNFYEWISHNISKPNSNLPFSEVMEEYCEKPDGRIKLLAEIKKRFDNIKSFPELYKMATRFHRELSTLPLIDTIITTNWDTYFEDECGATPFIFPEDFAYWNAAQRKVLKIHGSISNYGSIIATKSDYKRCLTKLNKDIPGSHLKQLLSTKTIVYIGYSFSDEDFQQIHSFIKKEMKDFLRQAYIVTLDKNSSDKFEALNFKPIITDGTHFINILKKQVISKTDILPDTIYEYASTMLDFFRFAHEELHNEYNCVKNPEILYCEFYQDGAMHAYERMLALRNTGVYSCECEFFRTVEIYNALRKENLSLGNYGDVAYIDGYLNAHIQLLLFFKYPDDTPALPFFYAIGYKEDIPTIKEYKKIFKKIPTYHKGAYKLAKKIVQNKNKGGDFMMHHSAYL